MLPPGLCRQVLTHNTARLPRWGFSHLGRQTERERIPNPRKKCRFKSDQHHLCAGRLPTLVYYEFTVLKVPLKCGCDHICLDAGYVYRVARNPR